MLDYSAKAALEILSGKTSMDGIRNNNELNEGINGVRVKLLADTDNDGQIDDVVQTTVTQTNSNTNLDGFYLFQRINARG